ncbi:MULTISPECIES: hypothetical protein [Olivibacter]|uniref:Terminase small subunit n=1 Tax=Olivibacter oleidegradans TaxID=760123 RepID=A0ABV6HH96_9SPHI|nr:hypothetical protein [Olivibacter jilunii]
MAKKKTPNKKSSNRIKQVAKDVGASSRLISLWVDVDYTTVSSWNSNNFQPTDDNLNQIGELLEKDNRDLLEPQGRINTGLAKALEEELNRLHKIEGLPYEVEHFDEKKGKVVMVNNPMLIAALKKFAKEYKNKQK